MTKSFGEFDRPAIYANFEKAFKLEWLPLDILHVPEEYQRDLNDKRVERIAEDLNPFSVGSLLAVKRGGKDGGYFLIDGEHRKGALYIRGFTHWHCLVIQKSLTPSEEADIWHHCNKNRQNVTALQHIRS